MKSIRSFSVVGGYVVSLGVFAAIISACSPSVRYYSLQPGADAAAFSAENRGPVVEVRAVAFPEYLNNPQMVTRSAGGEVRVDEKHRWVEDLGVNFQRVFLQDLAARLGSSGVFVSGGSDLTPRHVVAVEVAQFDVSEGGTATLSARYTVSTASRPEGGASSTVVLRGETTGAGREARVAALSSLVDQLAMRVAGQVLAK
jgi:uncharacterized lipoprotein YmbA